MCYDRFLQNTLYKYPISFTIVENPLCKRRCSIVSTWTLASRSTFKGYSVVLVYAHRGVTVVGVLGLSHLYERPKVVGFKGFVRWTERLSVFSVILSHTYSKLSKRTGLIKSYLYTWMEEEKIKLFEMVGLARSYCTELYNYRGNTATVSGRLGPGIGNIVSGRRLRRTRIPTAFPCDRSEAGRLDAPKTPYWLVYTYTSFAIGDLFLLARPWTYFIRPTNLAELLLHHRFNLVRDSISLARPPFVGYEKGDVSGTWVRFRLFVQWLLSLLLKKKMQKTFKKHS